MYNLLSVRIKFGVFSFAKFDVFVFLNSRQAMNLGVQVCCYHYRPCTIYIYIYIYIYKTNNVSFHFFLSFLASLFGNRITYIHVSVFLCVRNKKHSSVSFYKLFSLFFAFLLFALFLFFSFHTIFIIIIIVIMFLFVYLLLPHSFNVQLVLIYVDFCDYSTTSASGSG